MKEYRVDFKIKNNLFIESIEKAGYKTVGEFCRKNNINATSLGDYINMKRSPISNRTGDFHNVIKKVADILQVIPESLFSIEQINRELLTNKKSIKVSTAEAIFMLNNNNYDFLVIEEILLKEELPDKLNNVLDGLTPKEKKVLELRFGLNGDCDHSLEETGLLLGFSRERIRQIEWKALRKLRHPSRSSELKEFL